MRLLKLEFDPFLSTPQVEEVEAVELVGEVTLIFSEVVELVAGAIFVFPLRVEERATRAELSFTLHPAS